MTKIFRAMAVVLAASWSVAGQAATVQQATYLWSGTCALNRDCDTLSALLVVSPYDGSNTVNEATYQSLTVFGDTSDGRLEFNFPKTSTLNVRGDNLDGGINAFLDVFEPAVPASVFTTGDSFFPEPGRWDFEYFDTDLGEFVVFNGTGGHMNQISVGPVPIPLPAALPLLVVALGMLGFVRRRAT